MSTALTIEIRGMSCEHCACAIEQALRSLPGVESVDVTIGRARIVFDGSATQKPQIFEAVRAAGAYDITGFSNDA